MSPSAAPNPTAERRCLDCGQTKPAGAFRPMVKSGRGWTRRLADCRACEAAQAQREPALEADDWTSLPVRWAPTEHRPPMATSPTGRLARCETCRGQMLHRPPLPLERSWSHECLLCGREAPCECR